MATQEQVKVAAVVAKAIYQTILECGVQGAPSGVVFAGLQRFGMTIAQYDAVITALIQLKAIKQDNYVLYADRDVGMQLGLL